MRIEPLKQRACIAALLAGSCLAAQASQPNPKPPAHFAGVRGRCVDEAGKPLAGCKVKFWGRGSSISIFEPDPRHTPPPVTTGGNGRFEFRFPARDSFFYDLLVTTPGRIPHEAEWFPRFKPGQIDDVGDLIIKKGVSVSCRLVDDKGKPFQEEAFVRLQQPGGAMMVGNRGYVGPRRFVGLRQRDVDAVRTTRHPIQPGKWRVKIERANVQLVKPAEILVPRDGIRDPVRIFVKLAQSVSGRLVDHKGKPVAGAWLKGAILRTPDDGSFHLFRRANSPARIPVVLEHAPRGFEPVTTKETYPWGTTGVVLRLRPALAFSLRVVEKASGAPVSDFAVECDRVGGQERGPRLAGSHKRGVVEVTDVHRGTNRIRIVPKSYRLLVTEYQEFVASDKQPGPPTRVIKVGALTALKVHVRNTNNQALNGVLVEVLKPGQDEVDTSTPFHDPRMAGRWRGPVTRGSRYLLATLLSRARTNAGGHCIVYGQQGLSDLAIRLTTKEGKKQVQQGVRFGGKNMSLRIQIE